LSEEKKVVKIFMEGGLIQNITDIPNGVEVEVIDFDAKESGTQDEICHEPNCPYKDTHYKHNVWK